MKGWRTILFNLATLAAVLTPIPGLNPAVVVIINGVGNIVLRILTDSAVGTAGATK